MSKYNNRNIITNLSRLSGLPIDMLSGSPMFHLYSHNELVIEGVRSIEHYDTECVKIKAIKCFISVSGRNLCIKCLADKNLSVCGNIEGITFEHI